MAGRTTPMHGAHVPSYPCKPEAPVSWELVGGAEQAGSARLFPHHVSVLGHDHNLSDCIPCTVVSGTENQLGAGSEGRTSMEGPPLFLSHEISAPGCRMALLRGKQQMKQLAWEAGGTDGDRLPSTVK